MQQQLTAQQQELINEYKRAVDILKDANNALATANSDEAIFLNKVIESLKKYVIALASYAAYKKIPQLDADTLKLISSEIEYFMINTEYYATVYVNDIIFATGLSYKSYDDAFEDAAAKGIRFMNLYPNRMP